jgi:hypothetical protein
MAVADVLDHAPRYAHIASLLPALSAGAVTDILLLTTGVRTLTRLSCAVDNVPSILHSLRQLGLYGCRWRRDVDPVRAMESDRAGYVIASRPVERGTGKRTFIFAARDEPVAELVEALCLDDAAQGALLGYPTCCIRAFEQNRAQYLKRLCPAFAQSGAPAMPFWANTMADLFGWRLTSHFPCAPDCDSTRRLALRYWSALAAADVVHAVSTLVHLRSIVVECPDRGLVYGTETALAQGRRHLRLLGASAAWMDALAGQEKLELDAAGCVFCGGELLGRASVFDFTGGCGNAP